MSVGVTLMGLIVGLLVGLTGVGGASLLTPLLVLMGIHPTLAVGTDLFYNSITKLFGTIQHWRKQTIDFGLTGYLAMGSIPGVITAVGLLQLFQVFFHNQEQLIRHALGYVLIAAAISTLIKVFFDHRMKPNAWQSKPMEQKRGITIAMGFFLGFIVGLTSIGSGSLFALFMLYFYNMSSARLVGTDIAHAFLLVTVGGLLHAGLGNVDYWLVLNLLVGSIPGVWVGSSLSAKAPTKALRALIASLILISGYKIL